MTRSPAAGRSPGEATIRRVLARVDGDAVDATIGTWLADRLRPLRQRRVIAVDGKTLRGSGRDGHQVHLLAALDHHDGAVLAEAGVQHVIMNFAETNETDLIELLGSRVLPQFCDIEAADPRTLAANVPEAVTR